jgi:hypothetical protein
MPVVRGGLLRSVALFVRLARAEAGIWPRARQENPGVIEFRYRLSMLDKEELTALKRAKCRLEPAWSN